MASNSSLPSRMALHAHQRKATAAIDANVRRGREKGRDHAATASGKSTLPSEIREVLARKQRRWDRQLATAKRKKKPVVPQVFTCTPREEFARFCAALSRCLMPHLQNNRLFNLKNDNKYVHVRSRQFYVSCSRARTCYWRSEAFAPSAVPRDVQWALIYGVWVYILYTYRCNIASVLSNNHCT